MTVFNPTPLNPYAVPASEYLDGALIRAEFYERSGAADIDAVFTWLMRNRAASNTPCFMTLKRSLLAQCETDNARQFFIGLCAAGEQLQKEELAEIGRFSYVPEE